MPEVPPRNVRYYRRQDGTGGGPLPTRNEMMRGIAYQQEQQPVVVQKKNQLDKRHKAFLDKAQDYIPGMEELPRLSDVADVARDNSGTTGSLAVAVGGATALFAGPAGLPFGAKAGDMIEEYSGFGTVLRDAQTRKYELGKTHYSDHSSGIPGVFSDIAASYKTLFKGAARILGMGDYSIQANTLVKGGGTLAQGAKIIPNGNRSVRILYKEYLGDVYTHPTVAGAFNLAAYPINPGLVQTFPWLATIAQQYEQWTPNGIAFEFKSTSSEYVSTQALGSVIMSTEYDVYDEPFENKQEMLNSCYSNEAKPSQHIVHGVECDPRDNPLSIFYTRTGANDTNADASLRETDLGVFYIATQGGATANLNLGSLYIVYDITLRKEQMFNGVRNKGLILDCIYGTVGVASATPLPVRATNNTTPGSTEIMTIGGLGTTINLPSWINGGIWRIFYYVAWTASGVFAPPILTPTSGCDYYGSTYTSGGIVPSTASSDSTMAFLDIIISSNVGSGAVITMSGATIGAGVLQCFVQFYQIGVGFAV